MEHVSQIYGFLFSVHLLATFAPMLSGYAFDFLGNFTLPFIILALLMLMAAYFIQKHNKLLKE
jgi:cyanate permease